MREKISKLAQHITQRNKVYTESDPEYYVYADILTDEHADILLAMERRKEEKVEDMLENDEVDMDHGNDDIDEVESDSDVFLNSTPHRF